MRLLLIEDEPTLRESVAKKLRRSGYEMDDCGDGETALELLAAERYIRGQFLFIRLFSGGVLRCHSLAN